MYLHEVQSLILLKIAYVSTVKSIFNSSGVKFGSRSSLLPPSFYDLCLLYTCASLFGSVLDLYYDHVVVVRCDCARRPSHQCNHVHVHVGFMCNCDKKARPMYSAALVFTKQEIKSLFLRRTHTNSCVHVFISLTK